MILELSDQDNVALEEISKILERHPDLKLIEMVVEPTLIFNHLIIDTGKRKVYYTLDEGDNYLTLEGNDFCGSLQVVVE